MKKNMRLIILINYLFISVVPVINANSINWSIFDLSGSSNTSTNYQLSNSLAWGVVKKSSSANYSIQSGFFNYGIFKSPAAQTGSISGQITDNSSGSAIQGVLVEAKNSDSKVLVSSTTSDSSGNYSFTITTGTFDIVASHYRYYTSTTSAVSLLGDESKTVNIVLVSTTVTLVSAIISQTHPEEDIEYCEDSPIFSWAKPSSDIVGYYYIFNQSSSTVPTAITGTYTTLTSVLLSDISDGTHYLHIVAENNAGYIGTSAKRYKIKIKTAVNTSQTNIFLTEDGTKVEIPANSVETATKLKIDVPSASSIPKRIYDSNLKDLEVIKEIKFTDAAISLKKEITITLTYKDSDITEINENNLKAAYYDEDLKKWKIIFNATPYPTQNKIVFNVDHLTLFRIIEYTAPTEILSGLSNYPNPFTAGNNNNTKIRYTLKKDKDIEIKIYDLIGELVWLKEILSGDAGAQQGANEVTWDGKNENGDYVTVGGYICIVKAKNKVEKTKIGVK